MEPTGRKATRFDLELEFVLCLANPSYLQWLAVTHSTLLNESESTAKSDEDSDHARFVRYLRYLYEYWKRPEYAKYLTHPAATLRNLKLLQNEGFRSELARPEVMHRLTEGLDGINIEPPGAIDGHVASQNEATSADLE